MLILFVLRNLTFCNVCKTIVLVVLRDVETDMLALLANTHRDEVVDKPIAEVAHYERIDDDYCEGEEVIEEYYETFPSACYESFLNEYSRQNSTEDTACAMCWEYVEGIVNAGLASPINGCVTDKGDYEGDENTLTNCYVAC